jgi:hypothetical protein
MVPDVDYAREVRSKARAMLNFFLGLSQISIWLSLAHVTQKLVWCAHREPAVRSLQRGMLERLASPED